MEEPVEYGCGYKDAKLGEKVEFFINGVWSRAIVAKIHKQPYGEVSYALIDDDGLEYAMSSEWVKQVPYGVSYVADKPMDTPEHYKMAIEPIEIIQKNGLGFIEGNILKYLLRWRKKGGKSDLLKIKHYTDLLLKYEYPDLENKD